MEEFIIEAVKMALKDIAGGFISQDDPLLSLFSPKMADPEVKIEGDTVIVNHLRMMKNFPKKVQEELVLKSYNLKKDDILEFIYNKEGYIEGCKLKDKTKTFTFEIKLPNNSEELLNKEVEDESNI
jgi:bifunctional DNA-binding transcriptional regulator/antitoxin component of YhaV-PrlF toxin-antitoxin module